MRNSTLYILGVLRFFCGCLLAAIVIVFSLTSCVEDVEPSSKSIADYTDNDIKSYGDLFDVFWNVMNQRYCELHEQASFSSRDWEQVYSEYKPKFDALKTFLHTSEYTQAEIQADNAKAKQYFTEIIDSILDQHFYVSVTLPVSHSSTEKVKFSSTLYDRTSYFPINYHWNYTISQLDLAREAFGATTEDGFCIMGGFLKNRPDIYYLGFNKFTLSENCLYEYQKEYLPSNVGSTYHLVQQNINSKAQELVTPQNISLVEKEAEALLDSINNYLASEIVRNACDRMTAYSNKGDYYGLYKYAKNAYDQAPSLIKDLPTSNDIDGVANKLMEKLNNETDCPTINSEYNFKKWFCEAMANYLWHEREFCAFWTDLTFTKSHSTIEGYRRMFLEPLINGKIQKLILDLQGNTGGYVNDTRLLTDYLVSHTAIYAYVRKKEDNNPYSYTPWVPQQIAVTTNSLGRDIPTAILIDNYSASMSEMTSLILKSQGDHVKTIGRNSCGAQSMLTSDNEGSNGGWVGNVTSYLYFYMPFSMTKDAQGNILESVGITPDYPIDPMTEEERQKIIRNDKDAIDRALEKAKEILE